MTNSPYAGDGGVDTPRHPGEDNPSSPGRGTPHPAVDNPIQPDRGTPNPATDNPSSPGSGTPNPAQDGVGIISD